MTMQQSRGSKPEGRAHPKTFGTIYEIIRQASQVHIPTHAYAEKTGKETRGPTNKHPEKHEKSRAKQDRTTRAHAKMKTDRYGDPHATTYA